MTDDLARRVAASLLGLILGVIAATPFVPVSVPY